MALNNTNRYTTRSHPTPLPAQTHCMVVVWLPRRWLAPSLAHRGDRALQPCRSFLVVQRVLEGLVDRAGSSPGRCSLPSTGSTRPMLLPLVQPGLLVLLPQLRGQCYRLLHLDRPVQLVSQVLHSLPPASPFGCRAQPGRLPTPGGVSSGLPPHSRSHSTSPCTAELRVRAGCAHVPHSCR